MSRLIEIAAMSKIYIVVRPVETAVDQRFVPHFIGIRLTFKEL
jgi:hypothetical protein